MTDHLEPEDAARVGDDVLEKASRLTASEVRALARRKALRIKPKETEKAAKKKAEKSRDVRLSEGADGNAELLSIMAPGAAAAIWNIVNAAAWQAKKACEGDGRTIGQIRTDALLDLVLGRRSCAFHPDGTPTKTTKPATTTRPDRPSNTTPSADTFEANDAAEASHPAAASGSGNASDAAGAGAGEATTGASDMTAPENTTDPSEGRPDSHNTGNNTPDTGTAAPKPEPRTVVNVGIPLSEFLKLFPKPIGDTEADPDESSDNTCAPGEIEGLGDVPAWVIRDLVSDATGRPGTAFRGIIFDDKTGTFIAATSLMYRPPAGLADHVRLRDKVCRYPGCRRAARYCDLDHVTAWHLGGTTAEDCLHCLCRMHHRLKQSPGWHLHYKDGYACWIAPTGHTYTTEPHDYRD